MRRAPGAATAAQATGALQRMAWPVHPIPEEAAIVNAIVRIGEPGAFAPAPGFETPLEMLSECHRRAEERCATMRHLVPHLSAHGVDAAAREAAESIVRYFDIAAPKHHADEEEDLFPALIESMAGSDALCLREIVAALEAEHRLLDRQWSVLRGELSRIIDGESTGLDQRIVEAFARDYAAHIAREERELLPMAERLLSSETIAQIGRAMRRRRGAG